MTSWELFQINLTFYQSVMSRAEAELDELGLEVKEFFLLAAVETCRHPGELARNCLMPKPTVTFMVKRLEKAGFVKRSLVAGDLRRFELTLTPAGRKVIAQGKKVLERAIETSLRPLSAKEKQSYGMMLQKLCGR